MVTRVSTRHIVADHIGGNWDPTAGHGPRKLGHNPSWVKAVDYDNKPMKFSWFGETWDAPVNAGNPRCDVPVGAPCARCLKRIVQSDRGMLFPFQDPNELGEDRIVFHLDCFMLVLKADP